MSAMSAVSAMSGAVLHLAAQFHTLRLLPLEEVLHAGEARIHRVAQRHDPGGPVIRHGRTLAAHGWISHGGRDRNWTGQSAFEYNGLRGGGGTV